MSSARLTKTTEGLKRTVTVQFPGARFQLVRDEDDEEAWGLRIYSGADSQQIRDLTIGEISRVLLEEEFSLYVVAVRPEDYDAEPLSKDPAVSALLKEPLGAPVQLTRKQALAIVQAGIGARPHLPPGTRYVRQVKEAWRGLTSHGTVSS